MKKTKNDMDMPHSPDRIPAYFMFYGRKIPQLFEGKSDVKVFHTKMKQLVHTLEFLWR